MGNKLEITKSPLICDFAKAVIGVDSQKSNSASPTDTWALILATGVTYRKRPLQKGFLKWFVNKTSGESDERTLKILALVYEIRVYKLIISPLMDHHICPNFVRYLGSSLDCRVQDLVAVLQKQYPSIAPIELKKAIERNAYYMMRNLKNRPNIQTQLEENKGERYNLEYENLGILLTEFGSTTTFSDFLSSRSVTEVDVWTILFQVICALYALELSQTMHHDLHLNNIMLDFTPEKPVPYYYNWRSYNLTTKFRVRLFDFDRSFSAQLGGNPFLSAKRWLCKEDGSCNVFTPGKDAAQVWCNLLNRTDDSRFKKELLSVLTDDSKAFAKIRQDHDCHMRDMNQSRSGLKPKHFRHIFPMAYVLDNIARKLMHLGKMTDRHSKKAFTCHPAMFDADGTFKGVAYLQAGPPSPRSPPYPPPRFQSPPDRVDPRSPAYPPAGFAPAELRKEPRSPAYPPPGFARNRSRSRTPERRQRQKRSRTRSRTRSPSVEIMATKPVDWGRRRSPSFEMSTTKPAHWGRRGR